MKKFIIITLILLSIIFCGVIYLNQVFLPTKIKSLVVTAIEKQSGKKVTLRSLEFNIFKGLVLRDLVVSDSNQIILSVRQANCTVFFLPIFKKQIIIPSINLQAPYIFLERRADNSFNLQDFFTLPDTAAKKSNFSVAVYKVSVANGSIVFQDSSLPVKFKKELKNIQFSLHLGLPVSVKFNFNGEIPNNLPVLISVSGEYRILQQELIGNLKVKNLSPQEFQVYYHKPGLDLVSGLVDTQAQVNFKNKLLHADIVAEGRDLVLEKDKLKVRLNLVLQTKIDYNLQTKKLGFNGNCDMRQADILGLEFLGEVKNLFGKFIFSERSLVADSLKAELLGIPLEINLGIKDFSTPVLNINTNLNLSFFPAIAKEKFNFSLISSAKGSATLSIKLHPDAKGVWEVSGSADITDASLKLDKQDQSVENIFIALEFSQQGLSWVNTKFRYAGIDYVSSGSLSNFFAPSIELKLFSQDLSLNGAFDLVKSKIKVEQIKGKYLNSTFLVSGDIDHSDSVKPQVDLNGEINLTLEDLSKLLNKKYPTIAALHPAGSLNTRFRLAGDTTDFRNCSIQAKLSSDNFSFYGFTGQNFSLDYLQEQKIAKIPSLHFAFYDGVIDVSGTMNLDIPNLPYHLELNASGIKLEKLKMDTPAKNKSISGTLGGEVTLNGFPDDLNKLSGTGSFSILQGKLWELNLLQGIGKLLFVKDLANIEFSECACDFLVKDKFVYTDNLKLKSNIANLTGPLKIGLDNSLEGALDVEILSEMVSSSGSLKDVATQIIGKAGKFGVIKLSGTLQQPKYVFNPAVNNIIKGLTDMFFKKQS